MFSSHTPLHHCSNGNWIINLCILLCNFNIIISQSCDPNNGPWKTICAKHFGNLPLIYFKCRTGFILATDNNLPVDWPCHWGDGQIPFVFNFYSHSLKRLMSLVNKGHMYLQQRSCLVFKEHNPIELARKNITYLYYSYSGVLESCCLPFYSKSYGRRLVLITPVCTLPCEVAHATMHGLGLAHSKHDPFAENKARAVLFPTQCPDFENKFNMFNGMAL